MVLEGKDSISNCSLLNESGCVNGEKAGWFVKSLFGLALTSRRGDTFLLGENSPLGEC